MEWAERTGRRIKLRDLRILLAVAKTGSMGKAAAALAVSQPVISKTISDLEHALSLRLFDRSPQGVETTMYGRALLKWSVAVFDDLRQGLKELEYLTDPSAGELRIGSNEPMAAGFVSTVITRLLRQHPRLVFHVVPADAFTLVNRELRERSVELVVAPTAGLKTEAEMNVEILFDDRRVVMAGAGSKWVRRRKIALEDLINEPWVLPPLDSIPGMEIAELFRASGLEPPRAQVVSWSIPLHHRMLATEQFITILPLSMLRLGKHLPFKILPVELPTNVRLRPTGIVTLKNRMLGPVAQLFIDCARQTAKALSRVS